MTDTLADVLLATAAGADCVVETARFGHRKRDLLRRFRPCAEGTPSHDQSGDILVSLDAKALERRSVAWVASLTGVEPIVREERKGGGVTVHMVSAFAARRRLALGQLEAADTSNAVVAVPKLLAMLDIENAITNTDAMGCRRDNAETLVDRMADDILPPKGNQGTLHDDAALFIAEQKGRDVRDAIVSRDTIVNGDHGRIENRTTIVIHQAEWLHDHGWPGLKSVIVVDPRREIDGGIQTGTRLYVRESDSCRAWATIALTALLKSRRLLMA